MLSKMILHKSGVIFLTMVLTISYMSIIHSLPTSTALAAATTPAQQSTAASINNNNTVTTKMANNNSNNPSSMIGQLIDVEQGKIVSQRVIPPETPDGTFKMEVSYSGGGILNGVNVTEMWTFVNTYRPNGVIQGVGQGAISTKDHTEIASAIGYGRGHIQQGGNNIVFPTVQLYNTDSNGKLAFLKTLIGLSEWKVNNNLGTYNYRMWELK
jgi:hypothetical protein